MVDIVKIQVKDLLHMSLIYLKEKTTIILFQKSSIVRRRCDLLNKLFCYAIFKFILISGKKIIEYLILRPQTSKKHLKLLKVIC